MKNLLLELLLLIASTSVLIGQYNYEPSAEHPFGLPNPIRKDKEGNWLEPENMTWEFKYIMNGMGVQDQTLKEDGGHSGSIRQYIADSSQWYVHYYSSAGPTTTLSAWAGGMVGDDIILYRSQKAPNGMDGSYKITFSNISEKGFSWFGEWVNIGETFSFPTWKIECKKRE